MDARNSVQSFQRLTLRLVRPSMLLLTCRNPAQALGHGSGANSSALSLHHLVRLRTAYLVPEGMCCTHHNFASWLVSKGPAIGLRFAAGVPLVRLMVCPFWDRASREALLHLFRWPIWARDRCLVAHSGEHVTRLVGGALNDFPQMEHCLVAMGGHDGSIVDQDTRQRFLVIGIKEAHLLQFDAAQCQQVRAARDGIRVAVLA